MFNTTYRCIICLKNIFVPGFSPWQEVFYFWVPKGTLYIYFYNINKDVWEEHYVCVCPKDKLYLKENELVGKTLIETRLHGTRKH